MVLTLQIGLLTPPVGLGLYVGSQVANISVERTLKATYVFYISCLITMLVLTFFPPVALFLPDLFMGK